MSVPSTSGALASDVEVLVAISIFRRHFTTLTERISETQTRHVLCGSEWTVLPRRQQLSPPTLLC